MDNELKELLRRIAESNERILAELMRPKSKVQKIVDFLLAAIGIGGGISIVDAFISILRG